MSRSDNTLGYGPAGALTPQPERTLFGHPTGLFTLFFAEMWERFSYYGMRALLVLYMIKGFLAYGDSKAYAVYGAYTALVYATPFIGGMLADRLLGARRAVILGGLLMAAGHLLMTFEIASAFYTALALLICGNGFFKPNISTIVGTLYPKGSPRKDAGFTIFYMGINLGAAMAPILCGYIGEKYGWHYGFGLATIGMLIGVAIFAAPTLLTQALILAGASAGFVGMLYYQDSLLQLLSRLFLAVSLGTAGIVAIVALGRGGLPKQAGAPADPSAAKRWIYGVIRADVAVVLGVLVMVPLIALMLQRSIVAGGALVLTGAAALIYILYDAFARCGRIERQRIFVVLVLMFFSMLFWAFFEQAGSSISNFTDRNIDRVTEVRRVTSDEVGTILSFRIAPSPKDDSTAKLPLLTQEQLGYELGGEPFTMTDLTSLRGKAGKAEAGPNEQVLAWPVQSAHVGMAVDGSEIPASEFQAVNPVYILVFGLIFSALWSFLGKRGLDPSTPVKFSMGLVQVGIGFAILWYGAKQADSRGMVAISWLLLSYLLQTTGELCLSPVGLSMVTKLSPARIVSTMMGAWFLATAFSQFLAALIAMLTAVGHGSEGGEALIPPPIETVNLYGGVFGFIAIAAVISALLCLALSPLLKKWMHEGVEVEPAAAPGGFPVQSNA